MFISFLSASHEEEESERNYQILFSRLPNQVFETHQISFPDAKSPFSCSFFFTFMIYFVFFP